jgi:hydroxymethylglutaryl-CoA synthase
VPASAIIGFGRYVPVQRIRAATIAEHWKQDATAVTSGLGVMQKSVPERHEDAFTMAHEAGRMALETAGIRGSQVSAVFVGSESHPYAVKPTSSMLAASLELDPYCHCSDLEFACKAGTAGIQIVDAFVRSGQIQYGIAVGTDTAQGQPGDALEYTAAAGAAAFVIGSEKSKSAICRIDHTISFTTDTPDFWRAKDEQYPRHAGRFTGEPAYMKHVVEAAKGILAVSGLSMSDIAHVVLHMPNAKFPKAAAKKIGASPEQLARGFIVTEIGNTYSACSPLGLTSVLEHAKKQERILVVSYGSGSGADAFVMTMLRDGFPLPHDNRETRYLTYSDYLACTHAI